MEPAPTKPKRRFDGWRIVTAGAAIQATQSALMQNSFSFYAKVLKDEFGWSSTAINIAYSLNRLESGLIGPPQGMLVTRFGARRVMRFGAVLMAVGMLLFSRLHNLGQFYGFYLIMALGASLAGFMTITIVTVNWFERRRATALAMQGNGFAIGGMAVPLVALALERFGWRTTAAGSAVLTLLIVLPLTTLFHQRPADVGQDVDGLTDEERAALPPTRRVQSSVHFTAAEAVRTRAFWCISLGHTLALSVVSGVSANLALYLSNERGWRLAEAGLVAGLLPLLQVVGQFGAGYLGDRYNNRVIVCSAMLGHVAGILLLGYAADRWMVWAFIPLHGLAWGLRGPLMQSMRADYFGASDFGKIMGWSSLIMMLGQIAGPLIAGIAKDQTGSYTPGFVIIAALAGVGFGFFLLSTPPKPPVRTDTALAGPSAPALSPR
ncbi:MAG: MFS transporter [Acidimicrobiales bacterium]